MDITREIHLWDYGLILKKRKFIICATVITLFLIAFLINIFQRPIYQAKTELVFQSNFPSYLPGKEVLQTQEKLDSVYFYTQFKIIRSHGFADKIATQLALKYYKDLPKNIKKLPEDKLHDRLVYIAKKSIRTSAMPKTSIFYITVQGQDPKFTTKIANLASKVYIDEHRRSQAMISKESIVFLTSKLEELKEKLKKSEIALQSFPQIQKIKAQIYEIDSKLEELGSIYGPNHPTIIELETKKKDLGNKLSEEIQKETTRLEPLVSETVALKNGLEGNSELRHILDEGSDVFTKERVRYAMLQREALINEDMYQALLKKLRETDVTKSIAPISVRILEHARIPASPIKPNKRLNIIISLILGVVVGTGLAFFREYLDTTLKTTEDIQKYLDLSILGVIPSMDTIVKHDHGGKNTKKKSIGYKEHIKKYVSRILKDQKKKLTSNEKTSEQLKRISIESELKSPISESYRALRTNLQFACLNKSVKTIMLTSSTRGEGKTTSSINLAIIIAQTGKKVLLIDADLRRPRIHHTFNLKRERGLTSLLVSSELKTEDCILDSGVENLSILPSGPLPPNPSEILSSEKIAKILSELEPKFDYVLIDTPPLVTVTDAAVLASQDKIDSIVIVIQAATTPREVAMQGLSTLTKVKDKILGAVLNNINVEKGSYYYHYYHYDYAYGYKYGYGGEEEKVEK